MRKIDKDLSLATEYKAWIDAINAKGDDHPQYNSSKGKYYNDIIANLLWVQLGLCAYTEAYLMNPERVDPSKWVNGQIDTIEFFGQLEHFDSDLKPTKGWEWSNFFIVHSDINVKRKGTKKVIHIPKPDTGEYNPFDYLEYDFKTQYFKPKSSLAFAKKQQIVTDINTLGLNFSSIVDYRKKSLLPIIEAVRLGQKSLTEARAGLQEFYTAFEMSIKALGL